MPPPLDPANLFAYAKQCVDNKTVLQRIGHSAKLHSARSAINSKGSALSKAGSLVGVGIRLVFNQMPVPVVGSLLGALEKAVEVRIRSARHKSNLSGATTDEDKVKFTLKELSVEELDRFRWKVVEAIKDLNEAVGGFQANFDKKSQEAARCDAYLDLATAVMQAERRIDKLKEAVMGLMAALKMTVDWVETCANGQAPPAPPPSGGGAVVATPQSVTGLREEIRKKIREAIDTEVAAADAHARTFVGASQDDARTAYLGQFHDKCDRWCCYRQGGKQDNWKNWKDNSAMVVRNLASIWAPDDFNNNLFQLWKTSSS